MKKIISILVLLIFYQQGLKACDICGCGAGSHYIGILPDFNTKIIGLRYRYNALKTHVGFNGSNTYLSTNEHYQTAEIWGGWNLGKKFRLMLTLPFHFNDRVNQGLTKRKSGLGDISTSGFYRLFHSKSMLKNEQMLVQSLWIGAGIKIPAGLYKDADKQNTANNANLFQLGTGSTDFNFNLMYDIRLQDAGLNFNSSVKLNTSNSSNYRYGNKISMSLQGYYKFRLSNTLQLAPNAGMIYENASMDTDNGFIVDASGGNFILGTIGIEFGLKRIMIGANLQLPVSQHLALGMVKAGNRAMIHVSFPF